MASNSITVSVGPIVTDLKVAFSNMRNNPDVMEQVQGIFYDTMTPYVPYDTGGLLNDVEISPDGVTFNREYANYMYNGIVYGPNYPIVKDGKIVGWRSPKGQPKTSTGRAMVYKNPLATAKWDETAVRDNMKSLTQNVGSCIARYLSKLRWSK